MEMNFIEKPIVNSNWYNKLYRRFVYSEFLGFIGKELEGNILEVGCGSGKTTSWLSAAYPKTKITAIDYEKGQIDTARKRQKNDNIKFLHGDAANLKFQDSSFGYAVETNAFHHIKDYIRAIKEVNRVLRKNGKFYVIDLSRYFLWPIGLFFMESEFDRNEFIRNLEDNGFKVEKSSRNFFFFVAARKK